MQLIRVQKKKKIRVQKILAKVPKQRRRQIQGRQTIIQTQNKHKFCFYKLLFMIQ